MSRLAALAALCLSAASPALGQALAGAPSEPAQASEPCRSEASQQTQNGVRITRFTPVNCERNTAPTGGNQQTVDVETNVVVQVERRSTYRDRYNDLSTSPYILGSPRPRQN